VLGEGGAVRMREEWKRRRVLVGREEIKGILRGGMAIVVEEILIREVGTTDELLSWIDTEVEDDLMRSLSNGHRVISNLRRM